MAPPVVVAVFDDRVESTTESVPVDSLAIAPPVAAVLSLRVSFVRVRVPELSTAPPVEADPPEIVRPIKEAVTPPATLKTPTELPPLIVSEPVTGPTTAAAVTGVGELERA